MAKCAVLAACPVIATSATMNPMRIPHALIEYVVLIRCRKSMSSSLTSVRTTNNQKVVTIRPSVDLDDLLSVGHTLNQRHNYYLSSESAEEHSSHEYPDSDTGGMMYLTDDGESLNGAAAPAPSLSVIIPHDHHQQLHASPTPTAMSDPPMSRASRPGGRTVVVLGTSQQQARLKQRRRSPRDPMDFARPSADQSNAREHSTISAMYYVDSPDPEVPRFDGGIWKMLGSGGLFQSVDALEGGHNSADEWAVTRWATIIHQNVIKPVLPYSRPFLASVAFAFATGFAIDYFMLSRIQETSDAATALTVIPFHDDASKALSTSPQSP